MKREERLQARDCKSKPVHPESAMSGDAGRRADTRVELARAVVRELKGRDGEKGRGTVTGKP